MKFKPKPNNRYLLFIMRITLIHVLITSATLMLANATDTNGQEVLDKKVSIKAENMLVKDVLAQLEEKADIRFTYRSSMLKKLPHVSIEEKQVSVREILEQMFHGKVKYEVIGKQIVLKALEELAENFESAIDPVLDNTVTGQVKDENGAPLPGVNVLEKGTVNGTTTDADGNFSLKVSDDNATLIFSFIGYVTLEIPLNHQSIINISLTPDIETLSEVVVVGYGSQSKRNVTGSVSKVDMKQTENLPTTNISQSLRGRVAGVQFIDNGRPGQQGSILIRGTRSITASNDPLIILDGIFFNGNLSDINPNDIESIEILKDASSAAIYGSRAANGVILITSKKGTQETPVIRFNAYAGVSDWSNRMKLLSPERYIQKTLDVRAQNGQAADPAQVASYLQNTEATNYKDGVTIDPWDEVSQDASIQSYDVSIAGKSAKSAYFISAAQVYDKGLILNDKADRTSFRLNLETQVKEWFKIGVNSQYARRDISGRDADLGQAYTLSPYGKLYYDADKKDPVPYPVDDQIQRSPVFYTLLDKDEEIKHNLFANFFAVVDVPFVKGLSYRLNYSPNFRWEHKYTSSPIYQKNGLNNRGAASKYNREDFDWMVENIVTYTKAINADNEFDITLLYGRNQRNWESTTASGSTFFNDVLSWNNLTLAQVQQSTSTAETVDGISSMFRLNYRFKNRYLLTVTARRDGTSVFGADHKYGTFPSAALGWIITDEPFLTKSSVLELLKLRLSYGSVGNQAINPYQSLSTSGTTQYVYGDGGTTSTGVYTATMANPDLRWETTISKNIALDFELLRSRVTGTVEYYSMNTEDLLLKRTLPSPNGFNDILMNLGATRNSGLEVALNTINLQQGKFQWSTDINFSTNRNRIVHLYGSDANGDGKEDDDLGNRWFIGQPVNINYDYVLDGVYQEGEQLPQGYKAGYLRFEDISGNGTIGPEDRRVLSQKDPKYRWGIQNTFRYGNLSLSVFINAMQGWQQQASAILDPLNNYPNRPVNMLDAGWWTPENKSNSRPSLVYNNPLAYGYYMDRDFVRIQDVSLSYEFSKSLIEKLKLNSLRVYVSGRNLYTFTDYLGHDPEAGSNLGSSFPTPRTYTAGLNLSF